MGSASVGHCEAMTAAFDALGAALDEVARFDADGLATTEQFVLLERSRRRDSTEANREPTSSAIPKSSYPPGMTTTSDSSPRRRSALALGGA